MTILRRLVGFVGLGLLALGFYALLEAMMDFVNDFGFRFFSVAQVLADVRLGGILPAALEANLADLPAFFTLVPLGVLMAWWGLKALPPKPKFRKP